MYKISEIDTTDFYFNGHWLSEFGGIISGKEGFNTFSIMPEIDTKTDEVIGVDGLIETSSKLNPRVFPPIPIVFEDLDKARDVAKWLLGDLKSQDFYFKNDKIKVKAKLNSVIDAEGYINNINNMNLIGGLTELKFIAYKPHYRLVNELKYIMTKFDRGFDQVNPMIFNGLNITTYNRYTPATYEIVDTTQENNFIKDGKTTLYYDGNITINNGSITSQVNSLSSFQIFNDGNVISYPHIKLYGTGDITIGINSNSYQIKNISDYIEIDSLYGTIYKGETNYYNNYQNSTFPTLIDGINTISCSSNVTGIEITCNCRWV